MKRVKKIVTTIVLVLMLLIPKCSFSKNIHSNIQGVENVS
jgi:hypothetical protein